MKSWQIQVNMENGSILTLLSIFSFKLCHSMTIDDYVIAYNLSMLLTNKVTFHYIVLHKSKLQASKQC